MLAIPCQHCARFQLELDRTARPVEVYCLNCSRRFVAVIVDGVVKGSTALKPLPFVRERSKPARNRRSSAA